MKLKLDPHSPVPLYHQICEALRYQISTGRMAPGQTLQPVRDAAQALGVNMHTVRRAYGELARQGLVESRGPRGTRVRPAGRGRSAPATAGRLQTFVQRVLREAQQQHGLSATQLAELIGNGAVAGAPGIDTAYVVECSASQCLDHAAEIAARWSVAVKPWPLHQPGEPPAGPVVATYFHYNEIRRRWPRRLQDFHFVAIHPDPQLAQTMRNGGGGGRRMRLLLCELDEPMASNIAADLSVVLPPQRYRIEPRVVKNPGALLSGSAGRTPVLFTPRVWAALTPAQQADPRAVKVRYVIARQELEQLGAHFGWASRP